MWSACSLEDAILDCFVSELQLQQSPKFTLLESSVAQRGKQKINKNPTSLEPQVLILSDSLEFLA